jgi:hypothetical protein
MLFKETVDKSTLELLKDLMLDKFFDAFILVGGTALSLQIGHRKSIDLDFFSKESFNTEEITDYLRLNYNFELDYTSKNTIKGEVNGIQMDFIAHQYPMIEDIKMIDGIRMASLLEIASMKLNAITTKGTRLKDFIDIAFLSSYYSLNQMLQAYQAKYKSNRIIALKSLIYFEEVNTEEPIIYLNKKSISWTNIKSRIIQMTQTPDAVFG